MAKAISDGSRRWYSKRPDPSGVTRSISTPRRLRLSCAKAALGRLPSLHVDLDEASVHKLLDDHHGIVDFVTYVVDGVRQYAVILEERAGPSWWFTHVTAHELDAKLVERGANLLRVRAYVEGGQRRFAAVAERSSVGNWAWYADLDADAVASKLNGNHAYPFDLDATRDERGVRFTVVMYRDKS
jgi:hypothetical protein